MNGRSKAVQRSRSRMLLQQAAKDDDDDDDGDGNALSSSATVKHTLVRDVAMRGLIEKLVVSEPDRRPT